MDEYRKVFSEKLKEYLDKKEMNYTDLADRLGVNKSVVSSWKTGARYPRMNTMQKIAEILGCELSDLIRPKGTINPARHGVKIPVLGHVVAGYPIEAVENVIGEEEISEEMARSGDYFALIVNGQSMTPTLNDGDTVIIQKTPIAHSGQIAVVLVNGDEATLKEIKLEEDGLWLIGHNSSVYPPKFYTAHEVEMLPVTICGVLVELRRSFN